MGVKERGRGNKHGEKKDAALKARRYENQEQDAALKTALRKQDAALKGRRYENRYENPKRSAGL